jgi:hypothetical protein
MEEPKTEPHKAILARLKATRRRIDAGVPKKVRKHAPLGIWLRKEKGKVKA